MVEIRLGALRLASVIGALGCLATGAISAELPPQFRGVWTLAGETNAECKKSDWDSDRSDGMMSVAPNAVEYWESSCNVQDVKKSDESTYEVGLACGGEGTSWRSKEVWYVEKIASRRQLVTVSLDRFDERDDAGKRIRTFGRHKIFVSVHVECR